MWLEQRDIDGYRNQKRHSSEMTEIRRRSVSYELITRTCIYNYIIMYNVHKYIYCYHWDRWPSVRLTDIINNEKWRSGTCGEKCYVRSMGKAGETVPKSAKKNIRCIDQLLDWLKFIHFTVTCYFPRDRSFFWARYKLLGILGGRLRVKVSWNLFDVNRIREYNYYLCDKWERAGNVSELQEEVLITSRLCRYYLEENYSSMTDDTEVETRVRDSISWTGIAVLENELLATNVCLMRYVRPLEPETIPASERWSI